MIVEFFGISGSGKTTLCHAVRNRLEANGVAVELGYESKYRPGLRRYMYLVKRAVCAMRFACRHPIRCGSWIVATWQLRQRRWADWWQCISLWITRSSLIASKQGAPAVCLFDEGSYQAIWTARYAATIPWTNSWFRRMERLLVRPDVVVIVQVPEQLLLSRLANRQGNTRLERGLRASGGGGQLSYAMHTIGEVKQGIMSASTSSRATIIEVNDDEAVDTHKLACDLACVIQGIWQRHEMLS